MLIQPNTMRVLLCTAPTDMRKSINGLCFLVDDSLDENPSCGTVYVFCNRIKDKLKILYWDGNGFCLLYKRLEKGRFKIPKERHSFSISFDELRWLLQGIDFKKLPKPKVFFSKILRVKRATNPFVLLTFRVFLGSFKHDSDSQFLPSN